MYEQLEQAIEAAQEAQQAILQIDPDNQSRKTLDAAFNSLSETIKQLSKLLQTDE